MAQLRLGYPEIQRRGADVLQVTHNSVEEARRYAKFFHFDFPYLCDPDRAVHERYGLELEPAPIGRALHATAAAATDFVRRGERTPLPLAYFARHGMKDSPQAVFVIDRQSIVRAVHRLGPNDVLPTSAILVNDLAVID